MKHPLYGKRFWYSRSTGNSTYSKRLSKRQSGLDMNNKRIAKKLRIFKKAMEEWPEDNYLVPIQG